MEKVIILGGLGFLGSHVASHLLEQGMHVTAVDSLETEERENQLDLEMGMGRNANFSFIRKHLELYELPEKYDAIIYVADNEDATALKQIMASIKQGCLFLFISTTDVYTDQQNEELKPVNNYGETMLQNEQILLELAGEKECELVIMRLPTVYGLHHKLDLIVGSDEIKYEESGTSRESKFDLIYIDDVLEAIWRSLDLKGGPHVFHLGSASDSPWKMDATEGERGLSNEASKKILGFSPIVSLKEGLKRYELKVNHWGR